MIFFSKFYLNLDNFQDVAEDYENQFNVQYVQYFHTDQYGRQQRVIPEQNYYLVKSSKALRIPASYNNLLTKDVNISLQQHYLMQVMSIEKDIQRAKQIYEEWDWLEFILYKNSLVSAQVVGS